MSDINVNDFKTNEKDTGSTGFQVAVLTKRIAHLTEHLKANKHDHASRRGLLMLVAFAAYIFLKQRAAKATGEKQLWEEVLLLVVGAAVIAVGADFLVEHGQVITLGLGVPETVVALLFVALAPACLSWSPQSPA